VKWEEVIDGVLAGGYCTNLCLEARERHDKFCPEREDRQFGQYHYCDWCVISVRRGSPDYPPFQCRPEAPGDLKLFWLRQYRGLLGCAY